MFSKSNTTILAIQKLDKYDGGSVNDRILFVVFQKKSGFFFCRSPFTIVGQSVPEQIIIHGVYVEMFIQFN